jgi:hypothetical protein
MTKPIVAFRNFVIDPKEVPCHSLCFVCCTHTQTHTLIYTYIHIHIHKYIHTYIHAHIHTHMYIYIHTYIHTHTYASTYVHTYIHTYIRVHTYIYCAKKIMQGLLKCRRWYLQQTLCYAADDTCSKHCALNVLTMFVPFDTQRLIFACPGCHNRRITQDDSSAHELVPHCNGEFRTLPTEQLHSLFC